MHKHTAPKHKTRNYRQDRFGRWRPTPLRPDRKDLTETDRWLDKLTFAVPPAPTPPGHPRRVFPARALFAVFGALAALP